MPIVKKVAKKITGKVKITRKVISKPAAVKEEETTQAPLERNEVRTKKGCVFCNSKVGPTYTDLVNLKRFLSERAKIISRLRSGLCAKHQRRVTKQIKYARHLALLPFTPKV